MKPTNLRYQITAVIGTILEWFEYLLYGYMAPVIGKLFFFTEDPYCRLFFAYTTFALGFCVRPLGSIIFGYIGDRFGRRNTLTYSLLLMGLATLSIGLLPTYHQVGFAAPVLLVIVRMVQGLSAAGEIGVSTFLMEHAGKQNPYFAGSLAAWASGLGMLLASFVTNIALQMDTLNAWRYPFFSGALLAVLGLYFRFRLAETPQFLEVVKQKRQVQIPFINVVKSYKLAGLATVAMAALIGIYIYTCNIYFINLFIHNAIFTRSQGLWLAAFGNLFIVILLPIIAWLTDRYFGRKMLITAISALFIIVPTYYFLSTQKLFLLGISAQFLYALGYSLLCAPTFKFLFDLFPTEVRYTGFTFFWNTSAALFGGTAPLIMQLWYGVVGMSWTLSLYLMLASITTFLVVLSVQRRCV